MSRMRLLFILLTIGAVAVFVVPWRTVQSQSGQRCFPETGFCISGRIREFWEQNGGLPVFGFPTTPLQSETVEGKSFQAQWFERNRLELHPENPRPYDVLLGRLGADRLAQQGRDWRAFPQSAPQPGCQFFPETKHNVCGSILKAWQANGLNLDGKPGYSYAESLALLGLPLSEQLTETLSDGKSYRIQWFERGRIERHPDNPAPYQVQLGLLGNEVRSAVGVTPWVGTTEDYKAMGYPDQRKIVRDSQGRLYVAYRKKYPAGGDNPYHIFVSRSTDGGATWTVLNGNRPIENTGNFMQRPPSIAVDANDTLHVVWYGNDANHSAENDREIKYVRSSDGGATWSDWVNVAEVPGYNGQNLWQEHPTLCVSGTNVSVVWQGRDSSAPNDSQIKFIRSADGGRTWTPWQNVAPDPKRNFSRPTCVITSDERRMYLLGYGEINQTQQIQWTVSEDQGQTWAAWRPIAPDGMDQRHVSVVIDSANRLHAVWRQGMASGPAQIRYAAYDGNTWSATAPVAANPAAYLFCPSIAVTGQNGLWVAWTETTAKSGYPEDDPRQGQGVAVNQPAGGAWGTPVALGSSENAELYASLGAGSRNQTAGVDAVWLNAAEKGQWRIQYTNLKK